MSLICSAFIITINQLQFTLHVLFIFASHRIISLSFHLHLILSSMDQLFNVYTRLLLQAFVHVSDLSKSFFLKKLKSHLFRVSFPP
jgi:hypothetical protein